MTRSKKPLLPLPISETKTAGVSSVPSKPDSGSNLPDEVLRVMYRLREARQANSRQNYEQSRMSYEKIGAEISQNLRTFKQITADTPISEAPETLYRPVWKQVKSIVEAALHQLEGNYEEAQNLLEDLVSDIEFNQHISQSEVVLSLVEQITYFYMASVYCGVGKTSQAQQSLLKIVGFTERDLKKIRAKACKNLSRKIGAGKSRLGASLIADTGLAVVNSLIESQPSNLSDFAWQDWAINNLADCYERMAAEGRRNLSTKEPEERKRAIVAVTINLIMASELYSEAARLHQNEPPFAQNGVVTSPSDLFIPLHNQGRVAYQLGLCYFWQRERLLKAEDLGSSRLEQEQVQLKKALNFLREAQRLFTLAKDEAHNESSQYWEAIILRDLGTVSFRLATHSPRGEWPDLGSDDKQEIMKAETFWKEAQSVLKLLTDSAKNSSGVLAREKDKLSLIEAKLQQLLQLNSELKLDLAKRRIRVDSNAFRLLEWMPDCDMLPDGYSSPEEQIVTEITAQTADVYERYKSEGKENENDRRDNVLVVLRDWASSTPLLGPAINDGCGGGYFVRWRGRGIVIDPGFDFLTNFRTAKFYVDDIDHILISHNHDDHRSDFYALDNLCYELHKRAKNDKERQRYGYCLTADKDTMTDIESHMEKTTGQKRPAQMLANKRLEVDQEGKESGEVYLFYPNTPEFPKFKLRFFRADHNIELENALSFCMDCQDNFDASASRGCDEVKIGYTADTVYSRGYQERALKHFPDCDILIAHISQPDTLELLDLDDSHVTSQGTRRSKVHLGYAGVKKLIQDCPNVPLILIGEFWPGLGDIRLSIVRALSRRFPKHTILPASNGLEINLENRDVKCSKCQKWAAFNLISVAPASKEYGSLSYLCPRCRIASQLGDSL